ncbi:MAG: C40 family peptidase [Clostridia bacterium]|nr:C40 family peptidase [Clostridia bacterium]
MKKSISILLAAVLALGCLNIGAFANVQYFGGVSEEMCAPAYWADKSETADETMLTLDEIAAYNAAGVEASGTMLFDVEQRTPVVNADSQKAKLIASVEADYFNSAKNDLRRNYYLEGEKLDKSYFDALITAIEQTAWSGGEMDMLYAICTKQANVMGLPSDDIIGYSATDPDSESQNTALKVGDPCLVLQKCEVGGETFYYVLFDHLFGWVNAQNLAICADRAAWLDAWKYDINSKDILVVTSNKVITEKSKTLPLTSEVKLTLGAVLKLVPAAEIPASLGERNAWNNYTVYLPARDAAGNYVKQPALISQNAGVSIGFPAFTERNLAKVALSCLGDRYGWSGMLDAMDCTLYTRDVYRCFGFKIPRNTTYQRNVPGTKKDVSALSDSEKQALLETMPIGALLYMEGHAMVYLGSENGVGYVISALGTAIEPEGDKGVQSTYSVIVNPLTALRKSGNTWLREVHTIILPAHFAGHREVADSAIAPTCTESGLTEGSHCSVCKAVLSAQQVIPATGHSEVADSGTAPTCTASGMSGGSHCELCGAVLRAPEVLPATGHRYFGEVTALPTCTEAGTATFTCDCGQTYTQVLPAQGHQYRSVVTPATPTANGKITHPCARCDKAAAAEVIDKPQTFALAKTAMTYSGKALTPAVTVKDSKGKVLTKGKDYTVTYQNNVAIGKARAVIRFSGNYKGSKTLTFSIVPQNTTLRVAAAKKAFTAGWSKVDGVTGYQIQYATNEKFSGYKRLTIKNNKTFKATLKNLSANKGYYVRIRTYKTVDGTHYFSAWSKAVKVKTK